jgi:hypothetical protein
LINYGNQAAQALPPAALGYTPMTQVPPFGQAAPHHLDPEYSNIPGSTYTQGLGHMWNMPEYLEAMPDKKEKADVFTIIGMFDASTN